MSTEPRATDITQSEILSFEYTEDYGRYSDCKYGDEQKEWCAIIDEGSGYTTTIPIVELTDETLDTHRLWLEKQAFVIHQELKGRRLIDMPKLKITHTLKEEQQVTLEDLEVGEIFISDYVKGLHIKGKKCAGSNSFSVWNLEGNTARVFSGDTVIETRYNAELILS